MFDTIRSINSDTFKCKRVLFLTKTFKYVYLKYIIYMYLWVLAFTIRRIILTFTDMPQLSLYLVVLLFDDISSHGLGELPSG